MKGPNREMRLEEFLKPAVDMNDAKVWAAISKLARDTANVSNPTYTDKALHFIIEQHLYRVYIILTEDELFNLALVRRKTYVKQFYENLYLEDLSDIVYDIGVSNYCCKETRHKSTKKRKRKRKASA